MQRRRLVADPRAAARALGIVLAAWILSALAWPEAAQADPLVDLITSTVKGTVDASTQSILYGIFGGIGASFTQENVKALAALPNFQRDAVDLGWTDLVPGTPKSNLATAVDSTSLVSLGALAAVMTLSWARYWIAGLSMRGSGGIEAFEALSRTVFALLAILVWKEGGFELIVAFANTFTSEIMDSPAVADNLRLLLSGETLTRDMLQPDREISVIVAIVLYVGLGLMQIVLIGMKVLLTAGLAVLYVFMPVALALWPLPELSWVAAVTARAVVVVVLVPGVWVIIFVTTSALGADFFVFVSDGFVTSIVRPLVLGTVMYIAIIVPKSMATAALAGAVNSATGTHSSSLGGRSGGGGIGGPVRMASTATNLVGTARSAVQTGQEFGAARSAALEAGVGRGSANMAGVLNALGIRPKPLEAGPGGGPGDPAYPPAPPRTPTPLKIPPRVPLWRPPGPEDLSAAHEMSGRDLALLRKQVGRMRTGMQYQPNDPDHAEGMAAFPQFGQLQGQDPDRMTEQGVEGLGPIERARVHEATFDPQLSDHRWEEYMLTQATNPAYAPSEQEAWFRIAVGGRQGVVEQAARMEEPEGGWTWDADDDPNLR